MKKIIPTLLFPFIHRDKENTIIFYHKLKSENSAMKTLKLLLAIFLFCISISTKAQQSKLIPDLSEVNDSLIWTVYNRNVTYDDAVHLDRKEGDGLLRLQNFDFQNGTIELDIKGKNELGSSFVGSAFRGLNDSTYDAVYFRPLILNPERRNHSVQYISQPVYPLV